LVITGWQPPLEVQRASTKVGPAVISRSSYTSVTRLHGRGGLDSPPSMIYEVLMSNKELLANAFVSEEAHRELGTSIARFVYETAQRPGVLRTIVWHSKNHTVKEFTDHEYVMVKRIRRRHRHMYLRSTRCIVRQLRGQAYDGPRNRLPAWVPEDRIHVQVPEVLGASSAS
jgi:hypothetical protein